ncbi:MAG: PAS domain-containing protein, partial [Limisphaerales bacterium]
MHQPPFVGNTRLPSRVAWIYAASASAFVVLFNLMVALATGEPTRELWTHLTMHMLLVGVSAALIYALLRRALDRETAARVHLMSSQERFLSAVAHLSFTVAIYDADRRFRFLNSHGLKDAQKPLDEVLGRRDEEVFPLEAVNAYLPALNRALETRLPQTVVVELKTPSGHLHLGYTFTPLFNEDGTVREVLAVTKDMTPEVRSERRLQRINRTLKAVSAANSAIVRCKTEAELFQTFCDLIVVPTEHK